MFTEFFQDLADPDFPLVRHALIAGFLAAVPFGIVGTYVVSMRISYIAAAIAHAVLGGIGASLFIQSRTGWSWLNPMAGAVATALFSAFLIGWVSRHAKQREDTVISAIWAIGMSSGLLFIAKTPGYIDPMTFLFGDILILSPRDLWMTAILGSGVVMTCIVFYKELLAICYDREFAEIRGIRINVFYYLLLGMVALTVVLLVSVVGIVLAIALLTLPAAIAEFFSRKIWQMMVGSVILCCFLTSTGLALSYPTDLPTGAVTILLTGCLYLFVSLFHAVKLRGSTRL
jgi:zinc transport system permease protein